MTNTVLNIVQDETTPTAGANKIFSMPLHTIIMLIGPANAGKTTFTKDYLIPGLHANTNGASMGLNIQHISSDNIRRTLLGDENMDKMNPLMGQVGDQTFNMLYTWVRCATSYPVNADFVVVDTTGLSAQFRDDIAAIAKENHYNLVCIMFDYKDRDDYYKREDEDAKGFVTHKHVDKFKKEVLAQMNRKIFSNIFKVSGKDFENYQFRVSNFSEMQSRFLPEGVEYIIVGDTHGCFDEFLELLALNGIEVVDGRIVPDITKKLVMIGDLVDKGPKVKELLEFVYDNLDDIILVTGNHESFVYKYFKGTLDKDSMRNPDVMNRHYSSIPILQEDEELKNKFMAIYARMKEFYWNSKMILTHAPCATKYLGKLDGKSLRNQRYAESVHKENFKDDEAFLEARRERFQFIRNEANSNHPLHFFGHVMTSAYAVFKNKINIDTGCVAGNKLTSASVRANGRPLFRSVDSKNYTEENGLFFFFEAEQKEFDLEQLTPWEKSRIIHAAKNKVNIITGTISPADKDEEKGDIESLEKGLDYFIDRKVDKIVVQPKYMGSRATVYLFPDKEQTYVTSRGGYIVKNPELPTAIESIYSLPYVKERFAQGVKLIVIDAELLPWRANGEKLIDREFVSTGVAITAESKFLIENGFYEAIEAFNSNVYEPSEFAHKHIKTSKKDLVEIYGQDKESNLRTFHMYKKMIVDKEDMLNSVEVFNRQLALYASDGKVELKPFALLKEVNADDSETLFFDNTNEFIFSSVSNDEFLVVDLTDKEAAIQTVGEFYDRLTIVDGMEGIMLKPYQVYIKGVAPAIKVRNKNYLTIIYGPNYQVPNRLERLIEKKSISNKLKLSLTEWNIGKKMLEIPYKDISEDNLSYLDCAAKMIFEEKKEQKIDPRL